MIVQTSAAAGATHVGLVRANNEDAFGINDDVWAVADGLGGHAGGEVASTVAIEELLQQLPGDFTAAFAAAHDAILEVAQHHPGLADMGTTLVAAQRDDDGHIRIANVGDSRAYLLAAGRLGRLTVDDNYAQELLDRGGITADQARVHQGRFWLSKALGLGDAVAPQPKITTVPAPTGRLLLCTDGLNSELSDEQIALALGEGSPQESADALIEQALAAGGRDNVTVVVLDF